MSEALKDKVIEVACRNLRVSGCQYIVIKPDGTQLVEGELTLATKQKRTAKKINHFAQTGYKDIIQAMEIGDTYQFECEGDYAPIAYQKVITAVAGATWGRGNFRSTVTDGAIHMIRLG